MEKGKYDIKDVINNIKSTEIKKSPINGYGLFAKTNIKKNTKLGYFEGQIVPWEIQFKYKNELEYNSLNEKTVMVRPYKTKYSYINHSRKPNIIIKYFPLRIETIEDISKDTELLLDYRKEYIPYKYINIEEDRTFY